jgi:hypothetical protein
MIITGFRALSKIAKSVAADNLGPDFGGRRRVSGRRPSGKVHRKRLKFVDVHFAHSISRNLGDDVIASNRHFSMLPTVKTSNHSKFQYGIYMGSERRILRLYKYS